MSATYHLPRVSFVKQILLVLGNHCASFTMKHQFSTDNLRANYSLTAKNSRQYVLFFTFIEKCSFYPSSDIFDTSRKKSRKPVSLLKQIFCLPFFYLAQRSCCFIFLLFFLSLPLPLQALLLSIFFPCQSCCTHPQAFGCITDIPVFLVGSIDIFIFQSGQVLLQVLPL